MNGLFQRETSSLWHAKAKVATLLIIMTCKGQSGLSASNKLKSSFLQCIKKISGKKNKVLPTHPSTYLLQRKNEINKISKDNWPIFIWSKIKHRIFYFDQHTVTEKLGRRNYKEPNTANSSTYLSGRGGGGGVFRRTVFSWISCRWNTYCLSVWIPTAFMILQAEVR